MLRKLAYPWLIVLLVGASPLSSVSVAAQAAPAAMTLHVNGRTGMDSKTCGAAATPCKTIGQAITNASSGARIHVASGTYAEHLVIDKLLTIAGAGEAKTNVVAASVGVEWADLARLDEPIDSDFTWPLLVLASLWAAALAVYRAGH